MGEGPTVRDPFQGWSYVTVLIVFFQGLGGILVAATLKYADSVVKNFSIAGSIMLSTFIGYFYMGGVVDMFVIIGCICSIIALFNYALDTTPPPPTDTKDSAPIIPFTTPSMKNNN